MSHYHDIYGNLRLHDSPLSRHVIHTVGPIYNEKFKEEKADQLTSCYRTSLELTAENELRHIVRPSFYALRIISRLSTGIPVHLDWDIFISHRRCNTYRPGHDQNVP